MTDHEQTPEQTTEQTTEQTPEQITGEQSAPQPDAGHPHAWTEHSTGPLPTAARRGVSVKLIALIGLVLAVVAAGTILWLANRSDRMVDAAVGDCAEVVTIAAGASEVEKVDCTDPRADAVVTQTGDSVSCDFMESRLSERGNQSSLCLRPLLKADTCYRTGKDAQNGYFEAAGCESAGNRGIKVVQVLTDSADPEKCPAESNGKALAKRGVVYCLAPTVHAG